MHNAAYAIDDVWGSSMDLTGDASQKESQSNTVFDKSNTTVIPVPADTQTAAEQTTKPDTTASSAVPQNQKTIKEIEFYGLNSLPKDEILSQMKMKEGEPYSREDMQNDLKAIYDTGYFSEKMKAIPTDNPDGTVSIKIVVEENIPVKDFTIEGNTVIPTEDILNELEDMKGKPQNIVKINQAIAKIQDLYIQKGYILSRIDSVTDDPDGTINVSIKEGVIDKIMIEGNEKTKDYIIARNILTEPGMVYNENMIKEMKGEKE